VHLKGSPDVPKERRISEVKRGMVFDIKRYAIHDGPGIRTTVFLKGCPLRCQWCQNPEGQIPEKEIIWQGNRCPDACRECLSSCPQGALQKKGKTVLIDESRCDLCDRCLEACTFEALQIIGREMTIQDIMEEVEKDRIFYQSSGGGVTFSGGEPLMQPEFLENLLDECQKSGIPAAVDTCGYTSPDTLQRISDKAPLFLYDVKIIDGEKHQAYTGMSNKIILENIKNLAQKGSDVKVRIPLISGINDDDRNIRETSEFLLSLKTIKEVNLLPFHQGGLDKYRRLRREGPQPAFKPSTGERIEEIREVLKEEGFSVKYALRHADKAQQLAGKEKNPQRKKELKKIAGICSRVPAYAPKNFWEALQYYWFVHLGVIIEYNTWDAFNPGRLDQHLYPFYKKDLERGTLTRDQAKELLQALRIPWPLSNIMSSTKRSSL
jgi:pyruvate formate lyase activating enzyme